MAATAFDQCGLYWAFSLGDILFVPHYTSDFYVAPGYFKTGRKYTQEELLKMGAKPVEKTLWRREKHREILR